METEKVKVKIIRLAAISAATWCVAASSFAATAVPNGWYLEGNLGTSRTSNVSYGPGSSISSAGTGLNINAGYKYNPFVANEIGYTRYAQAKINNAAGAQAARNTHYAIDIAGKGILPLMNTGAEFFAKLGVSLVRSQITVTDANAASSISGLQVGNHSASSLYLGAGLDYSISPSLPVIFQWQRSAGDNRTGALDLYSLGVAYVFG